MVALRARNAVSEMFRADAQLAQTVWAGNRDVISDADWFAAFPAANRPAQRLRPHPLHAPAAKARHAWTRGWHAFGHWRLTSRRILGAQQGSLVKLHGGRRGLNTYTKASSRFCADLNPVSEPLPTESGLHEALAVS